MPEGATLTPMFRQYRAMKREHPHAILLFRMGDFYEMFHEDAEVASRLLDLTLTARGKGTDSVVPMCGFPHHQLDSYTAKLVLADRRVAVCEQVEDPRVAKGLVRREVVRVITPGTITDPTQIDAKSNVWIAGVAEASGRIGLAVADLSTGEFLAWQSPADDRLEALADRLRDFAPREIVHADGFRWPDDVGSLVGRALLTPTDAEPFRSGDARDLLERHFRVASLDGFGFHDRPAAVAAAGGLLQYLQDTQRTGLEHVRRIQVHEPSSFMLLDAATRRNLEIERSLRDGGRAGSLVEAVDETTTAAGGRLLRRWLAAPLLDPAAIEARHAAVHELVERPREREDARDGLRHIHDIERLVGRAVAGSATPRDLVSLRASLERLPGWIEAMAALRAPLVRSILDPLDSCADVAARLAAGLADEPPAALREGGVIRDGFHAEIDELRAIRRDGRGYIASLETREREATGIASLKVKFNKVFGYFIEVSRANLHLVPDSYHRKQTIANGERFVTPELKEHETRVLNAQERIETLETEIFRELRAEVASHARRLQEVARATATVDVLTAFAELAAARGWVRPTVDDGDAIDVAAGRHPVVERVLGEGRFVPNDTRLEARGRAIAVLTGPNMGGKSTYLRQVALTALLAQAGSFVPAERATVGIVDRIFCRVGASDNLAEGQSTFMVEMAETANILRHATPRSLILLDEIGRGTSTFDGMSIAWAVVEYLDRLTGGAPRTLFATHYHELTELAVESEGVVNLRMAVREFKDDVVFLHVVEQGASDRSYGIHVARLAGVPDAVVARAREILGNLERDEYGPEGRPRRAQRRGGAPAGRAAQPSLFAAAEPAPASDPAADAVLREVREINPDALTPLEALGRLAEWRRRLNEGRE